MAVAFNVTDREVRRLAVVGISMNKRVFSVHYTLTMETEHARDFISCTGCGNFLKQCLYEAQVSANITPGPFAVSDGTKHD
jgi:hypothetical protein